MQVPLEISFRGIEETEGMRDLIRTRVAKLEQVCDYMVRCRVGVEVPHRHQRSGNPFRVCIEITVPHRHDLVIKRESGKGDMHEPLTAVLRRAFNAARRDLKKLVDWQHGEIKTHPERWATGVVAELFPEDGYGFLEAADGREIYFHKNSVLQDNFDHLGVGTPVRFVEEEGEQGAQASAVSIVK